MIDDTLIPARLPNVGIKSTNSINSLLLIPFIFHFFGPFIINGTRVPNSKFVFFLHSPCSPSCQPWSPCNTIIVFSVKLYLFNVFNNFPT